MKLSRNRRQAAVNIAAGTLAGTVAGLVTGLLIAPDSGKKTRNELKKFSKETFTGLIKTKEKAINGFMDKADNIVNIQAENIAGNDIQADGITDNDI